MVLRRKMFTSKLMKWHKHFDERQLDEIRFSQVYLKDFNHGTDGHNAKIIIAKMASKLDTIEVFLMSDFSQYTFERFLTQLKELLVEGKE